MAKTLLTQEEISALMDRAADALYEVARGAERQDVVLAFALTRLADVVAGCLIVGIKPSESRRRNSTNGRVP